MRIPVFLDGWDIDCCLAVPAVGDRVLWSLIWSDEPDHPAAADIPWAVEQPLELDEEESRHIGVASGYLLTHGPISAWWRGAAGGFSRCAASSTPTHTVSCPSGFPRP